MRFTLPQFIEHEAKVVGPLTFKQLTFIGLAGAIGLILYYSLPFLIFLPIAVILGAGSLALAFLKIDGHPLPHILQNFFMFFISPKLYLWRKKEALPKMIIEEEPEEEKEIALNSGLKIAEKSHLKKLSVEIETKNK